MLGLASHDDRTDDLSDRRSDRRADGRCQERERYRWRLLRRSGDPVAPLDAPSADPLADALQPKWTAVIHLVPHLRAHETAKGVTGDDLAGLRLRGKAGGDVHRAADEMVVIRHGLPRVDTDADADRRTRTPAGVVVGGALDRDGALERGAWRLEDDVERVALRLHLGARVPRHLRANELAVGLQEISGGRVAVSLDEGRVVTEVAEQEGTRHRRTRPFRG